MRLCSCCTGGTIMNYRSKSVSIAALTLLIILALFAGCSNNRKNDASAKNESHISMVEAAV